MTQKWMVLLLVSLPLPVYADGTVAFVAGLEFHGRGDHWDTVEKTDGGERDIYLGSGPYLYGGALVNLPEWPVVGGLQLRTRLGFKTQLGAGYDVEYAQRSYPFELGVRYGKRCTVPNPLTCGVFVEMGAVTQFNAEYRVRGSRYRQDDFSVDPGPYVKAGWFMMYIGYWQQTYSLGTRDVDASSLSLGVEIPISFWLDEPWSVYY